MIGVLEYFKGATDENTESLDLLLNVVPQEKRDIRLLLELVSAKEQDMGLVADLMKRHDQLVDNDD